MQFLIIAYDYADPKGIDRRLATRQEHIALGNSLRDEGKMLYGAAILNQNDTMIGSMLICNFKDRQELDEWLKIEPYVIRRVWEKIEVQPCRVGPSFQNLKIPK